LFHDSASSAEIHHDVAHHCFIVADIVGKLDEWTDLWTRTADGRGRFMQPQHVFKGSIEVIGWDALMTDARDRNQAFFDKVGISGKSYFSHAYPTWLIRSSLKDCVDRHNLF
jgi:hypothetical protein